ncbi:MAG: tetratricopeptide repeat protein [Actinobacteria bacterium]|nr:tetratricopeptide repeat protein [Actinomycetota bacterium]
MNDHPAYDAYQRGMDLLGHGDCHQAVLALTRARNLEPEKGSIREALGRALLQSRAYTAAAAEFEKAVELAPTDHYAHFGLARALDRMGRKQDARRHYRLARCFGSTLVGGSQLTG